ncbi:MAG: 6-phosphogluconolactonase [Verrucomicrobiota bacterium]|nr:6-phosphogluconolactonase [Limisphaera sp.]MDW8380949.1 6-phosphogluconolactonase [Verrucomicrobiota bacterium]
MNLPPRWCWFADPTALARTAAAELADWLQRQLSLQSRATIALSGGRIAIPFYQALAQTLRDHNLPLACIHWFWADERFVPPDHPASNFRLARLHLLDPLSVPVPNQHPVRTELEARQAAQVADATLRSHAVASAQDVPVLDAVVLGMGEDGHIASLFPQAALELPEPSACYGVVRQAPKPPPIRITLTWAPMRVARHLMLLIAGPGKATAVRRVLAQDRQLPAVLLLHARPDTRVYVEQASLES